MRFVLVGLENVSVFNSSIDVNESFFFVNQSAQIVVYHDNQERFLFEDSALANINRSDVHAVHPLVGQGVRIVNFCVDLGGNNNRRGGGKYVNAVFNIIEKPILYLKFTGSLNADSCSFFACEKVYVLFGSIRSILSSLNGLFENVALHRHLCKLAFHMPGLCLSMCDQGVGLPSAGLHLGELALHRGPLALHRCPLLVHDASLTAIHKPSEKHDNQLQDPNCSKYPRKYFYPPLYAYVLCLGISVGLVSVGGFLAGGRSGLRLLGWSLGAIGVFGGGCALSTLAFGSPFFLWNLQWLRSKSHSDNCSGDYHAISVTQKHLTAYRLCNTFSLMANALSADKQTAIIAALAEGSSIRSIERITGVHRDTIMRLGVKIGQGCTKLMDSKMQDLDCNYLQFDELWGFIGKKERHCSVDDNPTLGDVWTFCAIDSKTKLVPSFKVGKRTHATTTEFVQDVASRMRHRVQVSSDAMHLYVEAMELAFGADVDYGQCVKVYAHDAAQHPERKYSAPHFASAYRRSIVGNPEMELVSTSHVERLNATTRLHVKRLSRLTLAFSKKFENFQAAVALHFAYYNFVRRHNTLRCTPAMAAGVERDFWTVGDLVEAVL